MVMPRMNPDGGGAATVTRAVWEAVPPGPVQVMVNVVVDVMFVIVRFPDVACDPLHWLLAGEAEALQLVALVDDQVKVDEPPFATFVGLAANVMTGVGGGGAFTVTVMPCVTDPPGPLHDRLNAVVAVRPATPCEPVRLLVPVHAVLLGEDEAVQDVAFVLDHVIVVEPPELTVVGFALMVTVTVGGGGAAVTITTIASRALLSATASATTVVVPVKMAVMRPLAFTVATETPLLNQRTAVFTPGGPETTADAV